MSKALTVLGMVVAGLIVVLFAADLAVPQYLFGRSSIPMDAGMIVCGVILGILSFMTYREQ